MGIGAVKKLGEPALGAVPIAPYPTNSVMRWALVAAFLIYAYLGQVRDAGLVMPIEVFLIVVMAAAEVGFFLCRSNETQLSRVWAFVLVADVLVIIAASAADRAEQSSIPLLAVATIFIGAAMFRWPYVALLTVLAAAGSSAAHFGVDVFVESRHTFESPVFVSIVILGTGSFAIMRGRAEERLRRSLIAAEEREREQSESLRRMLKSAQQGQALFRAFSEHAPAALMLYDDEARPVFASRYLNKMFGVTSNSGASEPGILGDRMLAADRERAQAALASALDGKPTTIEFDVADGVGRRRRLEGVYFPIGTSAGAIVRDVTTERELAAQVSRAQHTETLGTLAGGVAHDFNNLLTAILGNIYLARRAVEPGSPAVQLLDDARRAGERGADLVRRLLDYGRPAVERNEPVPLGKLVAETIALASAGLTPQIELQVELPGEDLRAVGDFGALQQVLLNLLVNARDAMPAGGRIRLAVSDDSRNGGAAGHYEVAVTDTGTGIAGDALERIFDPFFTTKDVGKGTGLGLATAMSVMHAHGGTILVESTVGAGSTFRMVLPARVAAEVTA